MIAWMAGTEEVFRLYPTQSHLSAVRLVGTVLSAYPDLAVSVKDQPDTFARRRDSDEQYSTLFELWEGDTLIVTWGELRCELSYAELQQEVTL